MSPNHRISSCLTSTPLGPIVTLSPDRLSSLVRTEFYQLYEPT